MYMLLASAKNVLWECKPYMYIYMSALSVQIKHSVIIPEGP